MFESFRGKDMQDKFGPTSPCLNDDCYVSFWFQEYRGRVILSSLTFASIFKYIDDMAIMYIFGHQ